MPAARNASLRSVVRTTGAVVLAISNLLGCPSGSPNETIRRQVSWLSGLRLWPPSRFPSGILAIGLPTTVAGAATDWGRKEPLTAFPFDPREGHRHPLDSGHGEAPSTGFSRPLSDLAGRCIADNSARPNRKAGTHAARHRRKRTPQGQ